VERDTWARQLRVLLLGKLVMLCVVIAADTLMLYGRLLFTITVHCAFSCKHSACHLWIRSSNVKLRVVAGIWDLTNPWQGPERHFLRGKSQWYEVNEPRRCSASSAATGTFQALLAMLRPRGNDMLSAVPAREHAHLVATILINFVTHERTGLALWCVNLLA